MNRVPTPSRLKLRPYELAAAAYVIAAVVTVESLPIRIPRLAFFVSHSTPGLLIFTLATIISLVRFRKDLRRWRGEVAAIARCCAAAVLVFSSSFVVKSMIYAINPRVWDRELMALDRALHFGFSPSLFLTALFDHPTLLRALDFYYSQLYFLVFVGGPAVLLARLDPVRRTRFIAALVYMWIAGNILYVALPSWGPVFVASSMFEKTLPYMPATVFIQTQLYNELSALVKNPTSAQVGFGTVAALPSLHIAFVTLLAIVTARSFQARVGLLVTGVVLMQIGSVVTGYHYMLDGYVGALISAGAWWASKFGLRSADGNGGGAGGDDAH